MSPTARAALGQAAEDAVCNWLRERGVQLVARNLRLGHLELDIVARQGPLILVIEVRTRSASSWTTGLGSFSGAKRRNLILATRRLWSLRYRHDPSAARIRIDAAAVYLDGERARVEYCPGIACGVRS